MKPKYKINDFVELIAPDEDCMICMNIIEILTKTTAAGTLVSYHGGLWLKRKDNWAIAPKIFVTEAEIKRAHSKKK